EFVRPVQRGQHRQIDQASHLARHLRPRPQPSPAGLGYELLHGHVEIVRARKVALDVLGAEHFLAHGESLVPQFFDHSRSFRLICARRSGERMVQLADRLDPQLDRVTGFEETAPSHATPAGVPVSTRSPGWSVTREDSIAICSAVSKISLLVWESCISSPFTHSLMPSWCGSRSSPAGTIQGPRGQEPSKHFWLTQS